MGLICFTGVFMLDYAALSVEERRENRIARMKARAEKRRPYYEANPTVVKYGLKYRRLLADIAFLEKENSSYNAMKSIYDIPDKLFTKEISLSMAIIICNELVDTIKISSLCYRDQVFLKLLSNFFLKSAK